MHSIGPEEGPGLTLEDVLDTLDEVYYYVTPDGTLVQWNESLSAVSGYTNEEIASMTVRDFFGPADHATVGEILRSVQTEREPATAILELQTKDGRYLPYEFSAKPVHKQGVRGMVGIGRELTEQQARRRQLETLVENVPVVLFALDSDGRFTLSRGKGLERLGLEPGEVVGQSVFDLYSDYPHLLDAIERALEGNTVRATVTLQDQTFETWCQPVRSNDVVEQVVAISRSVTERKAYERQLKKQRDNLEVLNEVVRHDIRNDLQLVQAYTEILEAHIDAEGREYLDILKESAQNAVDLTNTARDLSEVMLQNDSDTRQIPLSPTLDQQISEVRLGYPNAVITVEDTLPSTHVVGTDMLGSVFRNLLKNAIQHNDKPVAKVSVYVAVEADRDVPRVVVRVADNGPGIREVEREDIFGKGQKGLESDGTGIGLYLVEEVVSSYGGDVWIEDNEPTGAIFAVSLPIASS